MSPASRSLAYPLFHPESRRPIPLALSLADFRAAFPGESEFVEFKRGTSQEELQSTAVAFSNADGGVILIGVRDDGSIAARALDAGTQDDIHRAMQAARDVGRYALFQLDVDGKPVCVVAVARRREGFAQTSGGVVRVRRGTRDDPLFGGELVRFANERSITRYETTSVDTPLADASPQLRREIGRALGLSRSTGERLAAADLADGDRLTVAGALYLLADPAATLGKVYVEVLRYPDDKTVDYDRRDEIRGPLHHVLQRTVSRIADELGTELVVLGTRRYELPRLPEVVVREAVANALAHRSYEAAGAPVRVELRPSMAVVRSPGGLPEPVTVENMRETNASRNAAVIRVLRRLGLAEDVGRGVDVMQDTMAAEMLDPPRFQDHGHEVVVELPIRSAVAPQERAWVHELERRGDLRGSERIVLVHAARGDTLTNRRVRELIAVDAHGARDVLHRLRDQGFLEQQGQRGGASYRLSGSLRPPAGLRLSTSELADLVLETAQQGSITNSDVRAATGLDRAEALALLTRLVEEGRLIRTGERRGAKYSRPERSADRRVSRRTSSA
jgi:ATP-dependent DNA helicase RecG